MGSGPLGRGYTRACATRCAKIVRTSPLILLAVLLVSACGEDPPRPAEDIESAVVKYLAERTDLRLDEMTVRADRIRYDGNRAVVSVSIVAAGDPKAAMKMVYELMRDQDGWQVVQMPAPTDSTGVAPPLPEGSSRLPPGHPPTGQARPPLPPGHPPLSEGSN